MVQNTAFFEKNSKYGHFSSSESIIRTPYFLRIKNSTNDVWQGLNYASVVGQKPKPLLCFLKKSFIFNGQTLLYFLALHILKNLLETFSLIFFFTLLVFFQKLLTKEVNGNKQRLCLAGIQSNLHMKLIDHSPDLLEFWKYWQHNQIKSKALTYMTDIGVSNKRCVKGSIKNGMNS